MKSIIYFIKGTYSIKIYRNNNVKDLPKPKKPNGLLGRIYYIHLKAIFEVATKVCLNEREMNIIRAKMYEIEQQGEL